MKLAALDIGGTSVKYGIFHGAPCYGTFSVGEDGGSWGLPEKILTFLSTYDVDCVGFAVPGPFDYETGTSHMTHKLASLYQISLKNILKQRFPHIQTFFIHDAVAFIFGAIADNPSLSSGDVSGIMLGTGLGYIHCINGRAEVNQNRTPLRPLWNKPYKDGIAEDYVSAAAIMTRAEAQGYHFQNVKEIAAAAQGGDTRLLRLFEQTGVHLGTLVEAKQKEDGFSTSVIGGQVSGAWEQMREGFESVCTVPYQLIREPAKCPLFGIRYCAEKGAESIYYGK